MIDAVLAACSFLQLAFVMKFDMQISRLNVAKAGGLQSRGVEGNASAGYCETTAMADLESSGFPLEK